MVILNDFPPIHWMIQTAILYHTYFITQPTIDPNHEWSKRNANHVTQHVILLENKLLVHYGSCEGNLVTDQGYS